MTPWLSPVTLTGRHVRLEPLSQAHTEGLAAVARETELWKLWYTSVAQPEKMAAEVARRLDLQAKGSMLPFAVIEPLSGEIVGTTTYMNIDAANRRVEIGSTWYSPRVHRTGLNTEAKRLLLGHAFEALDCIAVELRTHFLNHQSRRAIERLGAKLDGILRAHQLVTAPDGTKMLRDTCVYSITAAEWPTVRTHLDWQLAKPRAL